MSSGPLKTARAPPRATRVPLPVALPEPVAAYAAALAYGGQAIGGVVNVIDGLIVEDLPDEWEEALPYAQMILRCVPMACLGGRSPYEVVTGLRPKMPAAMLTRLPVDEITVDQ